MNIALTGCRGAGKTTIARHLAEILEWPYAEIDRIVEDIFRMKIPQIVEQYGWNVFRHYEKEVIMKFSGLDRFILDLGGGAVLDRENVQHINRNALIFFLNCSPDQLIKRLKNSFYRPPLTVLQPEEEIRTVLKERLPLYVKCADFIINTEKQTPAETTVVILKHIRQNLKSRRTASKTANNHYIYIN